MKKVININFQGRVIPIEETAYEMLQHYTASLRNYFANEEGRDEIINDIENRIAELFTETLKKGAACITDADVDKVITSMGRPEELSEAEATLNAEASDARQSSGYQGPGSEGSTYTHSQGNQQNEPPPKNRLSREEKKKLLGGGASGLANYIIFDPAIIRIVFALLAIFGGSGFLIYIILWIVLPSRSLVTNIRKRLYRDTEDRVISGVCGGLAKYFDINPAIPRVVFAAPFIFGMITSLGRTFFDPGPVFVGSFGGGTFILAYIILWIVLPEALTAAEKLEMRGEKVDVNSIRDTIMHDLQGVKGRAQKLGAEVAESAQKLGTELGQRGQQLGAEVGQTAQRLGTELGQRGQQFGAEIGQTVKRNSGGLGNAIAILFKAFIYLVGGAIAFGLFVAFIALMGTGIGVLPLKDFVLQGPTQVLLAWGTLLLFIGVPILAILIWFIRRLMKVRTHNKYLGYAFTTLWFAGLFCLIGLIAMLSRSFSSQVGVEQTVPLTQPAGNKLELRVSDDQIGYYDSWFDVDGIVSVNHDTLYLNTVRINVVRSADNQYHVHLVKMGKGRDRSQAQALAERIDFNITQQDSIVYLPPTFKVTNKDKWRNQRVIVVVEVPMGKKLRIDGQVNDYDYFSVDLGRRRNWQVNWNAEWEESMFYRHDIDMTMTDNGLQWDDKPVRTKSRRNRDGNNEWNDNNTPPVTPKPDSAPAAPASPDSVYEYKQALLPAPVPDKPLAMANPTEVKATPSPARKAVMLSPMAMIMHKI